MLKLDETVNGNRMQFELSAVTNWFNSKNSEECTVYLTSRENIDDDPGPRAE